VATPLGFILSLLGVILDKGRRPGLFGLVITGAMVVVFLLSRFC